LILKHQGCMFEVPISHTGMVKLAQDQEEWNRESRDTYDEFTYESEELDEKEGYCTLKSEEKLDIYDNPWVTEVSPVIYLILVEEVPTSKGEIAKPTQVEQLKEFAKAETLGKEEKREAQSFFQKEGHLFAIGSKKLGATSLVTH
ncbi:8962_t:CDS:1, partial [Gigaspora rosea]